MRTLIKYAAMIGIIGTLSTWNLVIIWPLLMCFLGDIWFIYDQDGYRLAVVLFGIGHYGYAINLNDLSQLQYIWISSILLLMILMSILSRSKLSMLYYAILLLSMTVLHTDKTGYLLYTKTALPIG